MDFTILHFAIHIVWRANVICTCRKSGIARKTTVAYPELRSERFGEWLGTITRNVALRYMERKERVGFVALNEDENITDTDTASDSAVNLRDILELLNELPNGYGKVLKLYAIDGFSHKEIADILGIKSHSSSSQLSRAKALLKKIMDYKGLTVVLLLIIAIPLYYIISRKRLSQPKPEIAEYDGNKKYVDTIRTVQKADEEKTCVRKVVRKDVIAPVVYEEKQGIINVTDTTTVDIYMPEIRVAERMQDSTYCRDSIISPVSFPGHEIATEDIDKKSDKWQMLAAGSLGPALAQNIYRLITTGNIDNTEFPSDAPLPTIPENINTWEEYGGYLHIIEHANTPEDTLALMEIADHNHGEIVEKEQHGRPITFGISLSKSLSEKWSMETGLQYSILKARSTMGNDGYYIGKEQKIHYIGLPLRLSYRLADYKNLSLYSSAGMSLNIPVYGKVNRKYVVADVPAYTDSWHITPPVQWSTGLSVGVQYHILPKLTLYVEPTIYWHIPNGGKTHTIWTEHPVMFSAPFGIRIDW